jgi:hypothetical protein
VKIIVLAAISSVAMTTALVAASSTRAAGAASCEQSKEGTLVQLLEGIKRDNWRIFPAAEARKRTGEARLASFEFVRDWLNTCCLPRVPTSQASQCRAAAADLERTIREWDWWSAPRN